jgi:hypothetical protein
VVEGAPGLLLISFRETASSREASTSISANMRSITWIVGVAGAPVSFFLMTLQRNGIRRFYHVKFALWQRFETAASLSEGGSAGVGDVRPAGHPLAVDQDFIGREPQLVVHLGALADPVARYTWGKAPARLVDLPELQ